MLAYLMLFTALFNVACLFSHDVCIAIIHTNAYCFHALLLGC